MTEQQTGSVPFFFGHTKRELRGAAQATLETIHVRPGANSTARARRRVLHSVSQGAFVGQLVLVASGSGTDAWY